MQSENNPSGKRPNVALFVTCLVDLFRPSVGFASLRLLSQSGCNVDVPQAQTCCGQPSFNSGDYASARPVAQRLVSQFEAYDYVVAPSGSCAGMICTHYPQLLEGSWRERAEELAARTYELTTFLHEIAPVKLPRDSAPLDLAVAYHDGCAGLRELGIREQPRRLLGDVCGNTPLELQQRDACCGFGGTFCAKMPAISAKMADDKLHDVQGAAADLLCGGDLGCLLSLAGRAARNKSPLPMRHVAELLAGDLDTPAIGEPQ